MAPIAVAHRVAGIDDAYSFSLAAGIAKLIIVISGLDLLIMSFAGLVVAIEIIVPADPQARQRWNRSGVSIMSRQGFFGHGRNRHI